MALDIPSIALAPTMAAGWIGQSFFFSRFLVQWLASERARRPVVPRSFWWLSMAGALLVSLYALRRDEFLLLPGLLVNGAIAARNQFGLRGSRSRLGLPWLLAGVLAFLGLLVLELRDVQHVSPAWFAVAGVGQALWLARFPLQWWISERTGASSLSPAFWWTSLVGNLLLLAYALRLGDPVFIAGFALGPLLQARNLWLARASTRTA